MREIRVVIVVGAGMVPAWVAETINRVNSAPRVNVVALVKSDEHVPALPAHLRVYRSLDHRAFREQCSPLDPVQLTCGNPPTSSDLELTERHDVLVDLTGGPNFPEVLPRFGVWWYSSAPQCGGSPLPYFWEVYDKQPTVRGALCAQLDPSRPPMVLERFQCAASSMSVERASHHVFWKAPESIVRQLRLLTESDDVVPEQAAERSPGASFPQATGRGVPHVKHALWLALRTSGRLVSNRLRNLTTETKWFVAFHLRSSSCRTPRFRTLPTPRHSYLADPFPIDSEGETFIFVEEYRRRQKKGVISYVRVDAEGEISPAEVALEEDYHLSYPFVFHWNGECYMLPESSQVHRIELFKAVAFPGSWTRVGTLVEGVRAQDATLVRDRDTWWLFANIEVSQGGYDELHLFHSHELLGPWKPHPCNPVLCDVRRARPAGSVFRQGKHLIRPSQDCSVGYGSAIVLNRIDCLSAEAYRDTPIARINADWLPRLEGTHTVNRSKRVVTIDGNLRTTRWSKWHSRSRFLSSSISTWLLEDFDDAPPRTQ